MALALATKPRVLLLDEPLAGLAAAERKRVGHLIKQISGDIPVLLVEHDIDRVFELADAVTVMNDGQVLVDGTVEDARSSPKVQEVYIGSGTHALAGRARPSAAQPQPLARSPRGQYALWQEIHPARRRLRCAREEIVALLGRNGAGKSTVLKTIVGIALPARHYHAGGRAAGRAPRPRSRAAVSYVPQGRGLFAGMSVARTWSSATCVGATTPVYWDEERSSPSSRASRNAGSPLTICPAGAADGGGRACSFRRYARAVAR
jgi:ABC-type branched-subunit amino acid transport system ATPase component